MRNHSRLIADIRLNTHLQPLQNTASERIRLASNDSTWGLESAFCATNYRQSTIHQRVASGKVERALFPRNHLLFPASLGEFLNAQMRSRDRALINLIKYRLPLGKSLETNACCLLEVGRSSPTLKVTMRELGVIDQIQHLNTDLPLRGSEKDDALKIDKIRPDVVLALELKAHLAQTSDCLQQVISHLACVSTGCSLIIIHLPAPQKRKTVQRYSQQCWINAIREHFIVDEILPLSGNNPLWLNPMKQRLVIASSRYR